MYFVHPQINLNRQNIKSVFFSFLKSPDLTNLEKKLPFYFPEKQFVFTDMGRSAFKIIIEKLGLQNSQILFPAFLCDIFYPILKRYNIQPVFLDINLNTFHIDPEQIRQKINPEIKAILVCHTYGLPVNIQKIKEVTGNQLSIIEDCAHSFGASYQSIFTGNFGDVAFFSLYKQFPTFRGGLLIYPKDWKINLAKTSFDFRDFISFLNSFPLFAFFFKIFGQDIAPKMIRKEKMLKPAKINRISLNFFSYFLEDFEKSLKIRTNLALFFQEELRKLGFEVQESKDNVFCYLSALVPKNLEEKRDKIVRELKKQRVFCTRIWHAPIILDTEAQKEYQINLDEYPNTVEAAKRIINFPLQNHYTEKDIKKMILAIKKTYS